MCVSANAHLGHVGIVEYSKILIFEILNYTTYHYAPYVNKPKEAAPISYENLVSLINVIQLILSPYEITFSFTKQIDGMNNKKIIFFTYLTSRSCSDVNCATNHM